jgi:hypothetical protein
MRPCTEPWRVLGPDLYMRARQIEPGYWLLSYNTTKFCDILVLYLIEGLSRQNVLSYHYTKSRVL